MIFRIQKDASNPYVMVNKEWVNSPRLSFKAKGVLLYLLSKPDNWKVFEQDIVNHSRDGIKVVRSAIKELIAAGHIQRERVRDSQGKLRGANYDVYENPAIPPDSTYVPFSNVGKRHTTNTDLTKSDELDLVFDPTANLSRMDQINKTAGCAPSGLPLERDIH